jgi:serine phosphatase RsbU (regulator of sigma subunit)/anti-anti-sigma regulatory factor
MDQIKQTQLRVDEGSVGPPGAKERILLVDDEEGVRKFLAALLRRAGEWEVLEAADGQEAQALLARQGADLVITDLAMQGVSGLDLMQWAKAHDSDAQWIILTGQGTMQDAIAAVQLGAFDFVLKPLDDAERLLVRARNALRQRRLELEERRLHREVEQRNDQLRRKMDQLKDACDLLCRQSEDMAEDLRRAEIIQRALLPHEAPAIRGCSLEAVYRPSNNVGGDLYDIVRLDERYSVIYLADAAGHGVAAAMLAVLLKENLRLGRQTPVPTSPAEALQMVNGCLMEECKSLGLFVSAAYCLLDARDSEVTIASAGHPPLLLARAGGEVQQIAHTGPALGISADAHFGQTTVKLGGGDRLLLYTDGLFNAPRGGDALTPEDLAAVLADRRLEARGVLDALMAMAAKRRGGGPQEDDIAMILLTAGEQPSALDNAAPADDGPARKLASPPPAELLLGVEGDKAAIRIAGQGKWTWCAAFHEACLAQLDVGHELTLDLQACDYLDSTFLGTIQEVADHADEIAVPMRVQGVSPGLGRLFEELGMERLMRHFAADIHPLPGNLRELPASSGESPWDQLRVLRAHEALASLSEQNRRKFGALVEALRKETSEMVGAGI